MEDFIEYSLGLGAVHSILKIYESHYISGGHEKKNQKVQFLPS